MLANVTQLETLMASAPGPHGCLECEHLIFRIQAMLEGGGPQDWDEEVDLETARAEDPQSRDYWRYWRDKYGRPLHLSIPKDDIGWLRAQVAFIGGRQEDLVPNPRLRNCSWALDLSEEWPGQEDSDTEDEDDGWEDYSARHDEAQGGARRALSPISS